MKRAIFFGLAVAVTLAACGGGGGGGNEPESAPKSTSSAATGGWTGTTTDGEDISVVVLESSEVWGMVSTGSAATGIFHAPASGTSGSAFSASETRLYPFGARAFTSATLTGTVNSSTLSGTATGPGGSVGFNLSREASYNIQASIDSLEGTWAGSSGSLSGVESLSGVGISSTGAVSASSGACTITGAFKTRAGTAAYDITLDYRKANGCGADLTARGIAVLSTSGGNLTIGLIRPDRNDAVLVILRKSAS